MLLLGMSILSSCEKSEPTTNWLQGIWCLTCYDDYKTGEPIDSSDRIDEYFEFSSNFISLYTLNHSYNSYALFRDGVLTTPQDGYWEKSIEAKYSIEEGKIMISDIVVGSITKLSKDKVEIKNTGDWINYYAGIYERAKQLK